MLKVVFFQIFAWSQCEFNRVTLKKSPASKFREMYNCVSCGNGLEISFLLTDAL